MTGEAAPVVSNAELVVSELVTNASLHGEPPIVVRLYLDSGVRIEVEDAGRGVPILVGQNFESMTGRGLSMVEAVAKAWGVQPTERGRKLVWAEIGPAGLRTQASGARTDIESLVAYWDAEDRVPTAGYTVELGPVSTDLLVSAKAHMDNVVRELVLLREGQASSGVALPPQMAALVETVTVDFAETRAEIKRQAAAAAARGDPVVDLVLHLPPTAADAGERYLAALDEADRYARSAHLLTLAPPPEHRLFRRWYVRALIDHLRAVTRGELPPRPRSFEVALAEEVTRLSQAEHTLARLELLSRINAELGANQSPTQMAQLVVEQALAFTGIRAAEVLLLVDDWVLRRVAGGGFGDEAPRDIPLDSAAPEAEAVRNRASASLRQLPDRSHWSGHLVPLVAGGRALGALTVAFVEGEFTEETETEVAQALADTLAQAADRARLAQSEAEKQETLSFLAEANQIMTSTRDPASVLEGLVHHAVPRLADWCTVYLAEDDGLRRVAMAIDGFADLADQLTRTPPLSLDDDLPHSRAFRTGRLETIPRGTGHLLSRMYPGIDFASMGGDLDASTGLCAPIILGGERIGLVALTFLGSGRQLNPNVVEAIVGLASRAAIALDNAQRWTDQQRAVQALVGSLLPPQPPNIPGLTFSARYLPAAGDVAGDWWEADVMPDGTILVGLGDAAGHGLAAVSQMCELRHGARALAAVEASPSALLADLNRRLAGPDAGFATAVYGRLHPVSGRLVWASAGHLPPLYRHPDGRVAVLADGHTSALGTPRTRPGQDQELQLEPGGLLVLYSDGVIERRDDDLEHGIGRLVATVDQHGAGSPEALADAIIRELCPIPVDDCCLLLIRREGDPATE